MTERLYYNDCYLTQFQARVIDVTDDGRVYLDRTAFYPASGGQPADLGTLGGVAVRDVIDEGDRVAHVVDAAVGGDVEGVVDWARRYDHMQQHTGQHLLSAVLEELYGIATVSFHMGVEVSTIDVKGTANAEQIARVEDRCAEVAASGAAVGIGYEEKAEGLRKASEREGTLRIVSIAGIDKSACGGTHVRSAAETAPILIRKQEKVRDTTRLEFVCGARALRRAREDFRLLASLSRLLAAPIERAPELVQGLIERNKGLEKSVGRLSAELAQREGEGLYAAAVPSIDGVRFYRADGAIDDAMRTRAQSFTRGSKAVFLAVSAEPPSVLLAASADSGVDAGARVKAAVAAVGGRGGGSAGLAQGSAPDVGKLVEGLGLKL